MKQRRECREYTTRKRSADRVPKFARLVVPAARFRTLSRVPADHDEVVELAVRLSCNRARQDLSPLSFSLGPCPQSEEDCLVLDVRSCTLWRAAWFQLTSTKRVR